LALAETEKRKLAGCAAGEKHQKEPPDKIVAAHGAKAYPY
jgi:hypothetical protein